MDNGYVELEITSKHVASIESLPPIHKDPFDRLLIARRAAGSLSRARSVRLSVLNFQRISPPPMQRASQIIGRISKTPQPVLDPEQVACAAWPRAVGAKLAKHTRAAKLVRGRLVVEVEDDTWKRNLFSLGRHIMGNLERAIGPGIVTDIEFRVLPRRREPQRAQTLDLSPPDEADAIEDPVLRRLYKTSRSKLA